MLQDVLDEEKNASKNVLRIIETISKHNNTPRKKPKFINFVKNVCGNKTNPKDIDQAWDLISVKLSALSNANNRNQNKTSDTADKSVENGGDEETSEKENGVANNEGEQNGGETQQNGDGEEQQNGDTEQVDKKKLTKKQRKEEKKHKKYEAELQSAGVPHSEDVEEEETENKKGKKKKTKSESANGDDDNQSDSKNKNKKRKRQDTVNSVNGQQEAADNITDENKPIEPVAPTAGKTQKKKIKMDEDEEADESICLHDQNVAKIGELAVSSDKFNWHGVIISLLEKKGELPFKRLQKKVLGEYSEATGREVDDRIADKFIKKLKSAPNVRVDKNRVLLTD